MKRVIVAPRGYTPIDFHTDPLGQVKVKIIFRKRGKLGKLLGIKKTRDVNVPKGMRVTSINNHTPKVQSVTIKYEKVKKK